MKTFTRDSTIHLKYTFKDNDGNVANPASASVSISYLPIGSGDQTTLTYPLVNSGNDWIYEWDSSVAEPCVVSTHAQTTQGQPVSSIDVDFRLKANRANKVLAGDW
jgi:hypothetical protein